MISLTALSVVLAVSLTVQNDHGGNVAAYDMKVQRVGRVEISGFCNSACTLYLTHPRVCIHPGATFGFHRATKPKATAYLMARYPKWVRRWIAANGGLTRAIKRMNYKYARRYIPAC